jgi:hypothetical protein
MIKQFTFVNRRTDVPAATFEAEARRVFCDRLRAPSAARPLRTALCTILPEEGPVPRHDIIGIEWFGDDAHLARFEGWRSAAAPTPEDIASVVDSARAQVVVVANEVVGRGAEWLDARWRDGGAKFKHMAIARRAAHLTPAEFSQRWQAHAGTVTRGGTSGDLVIPDDVRGLAYVQDHPMLRDDGPWPYDAINEAYFDDLEGLRRRASWFEKNVGQDAQEDLVGARWFLVVREDALPVG